MTKRKPSITSIILFLIVLLLLAFIFWKGCDKSPADITGGSDLDDTYNPQPSNPPAPTPSPTTVACSSVIVPESVGDIGGYCEDTGTCSVGQVCDNYHNYYTGLNECGCVDSFFCQINYNYQNGVCTCPPSSLYVQVDDVFFRCSIAILMNPI